MRRYNIDIEVTYAGGIYDGDEYHDLRIRENEDGEWVRASDVEQIDANTKKLESKIERMQAYIDKLEGRS